MAIFRRSGRNFHRNENHINDSNTDSASSTNSANPIQNEKHDERRSKIRCSRYVPFLQNRPFVNQNTVMFFGVLFLLLFLWMHISNLLTEWHQVKRIPKAVFYLSDPDASLSFPIVNRNISIPESDARARELVKKSWMYRSRADPFETEECLPLHKWQTGAFPSCNKLHEVDLTKSNNHRLINNGHYRDVWVIRDADGKEQVLKTLRYEHDYTDRHYDRHRRDALAMERLTSSEYVIDMYAYCAFSSATEYGKGGDIYNAISIDHATQFEKLKIAANVAGGIADTHNTDMEGRASIAHTDIAPQQFIFIDQKFKLNDFNRCRFMRWNVKLNRPCGYHIKSNKGKFRSPEEYRYDEQDEKVDTYSMGNIFYVLLTSSEPFKKIKTNDARKMVAEGKRPFVDQTIVDMNDNVNAVLFKAMEMCHVYDPKDRSSARAVYDYLQAELYNMTKGRNEYTKD